MEPKLSIIKSSSHYFNHIEVFFSLLHCEIAVACYLVVKKRLRFKYGTYSFFLSFRQKFSIVLIENVFT